VRLEQIVERLREAGQLPRFAAPSGTKPPAPLKSPPPPITRIVGRRAVTVPGEDGR